MTIKQYSLWMSLTIGLSLTFIACDTSDGGTESTETAGTEMAGVEIAAGEMPAGEMPAGEMPAGEMPAGEMPAGEMPAGEMPAGEMPAGEMPAGAIPAGEMPAGAEMMMGACTNPEDLGQIESLGSDGLSEAITGCVAMCFTESPGCNTCLEGTTGLSTTCTDCFAEITVCTVMNCVGQCLDATSEACAQCRADNCNAAFVECAGVEPI